MSSKVKNLQKDILDSQMPLSTLLRSALIISSKLKLNDIENWMRHELKGYYEEGIPIPKYRILSGEPKAYDYKEEEWCDIDYKKLPDFQIYNIFGFPHSIEEIESDLKQIKNDTMLAVYPPEFTAVLMKQFKADKFGFEFTRTQFIGILSHVRNVLLDWTIDLEKNHIIVDDTSFASEEIAKAQNITINNYFNDVNNSQINTSTTDSKQIIGT